MKKSWRYSSKHGKEAWKELEKINSFGYDSYTIFDDWINLILNSLLSLTENLDDKIVDKFKNNSFTGKYNDRYLEIVKKYKENETKKNGERPIDYFLNAWRLLKGGFIFEYV